MVAISTQRFNNSKDSFQRPAARESGGKYSINSKKFLGENLDASNNAVNSQKSEGENSIQKDSPRNIDDSYQSGGNNLKGQNFSQNSDDSEKFLGENLDASKNTGNSQESVEENSIQKDSPRNINDSQELTEDKPDQNSAFKKNRRRYGDGSGYIYIGTVTKKGKQYQEAYYHYEFWDKGNRLIKTSKYIPKKLLGEVRALEVEKVPVQEILTLLGQS